MRAAVRHEYGPPEVVRVEEVPKPTPKDDELLVRVRAVSLSLGDWEILTGQPTYIRVLANLFAGSVRYEVPEPAEPPRGKRPKHRVLGSNLAGVVEEVGRDVTRCVRGELRGGGNSDLAHLNTGLPEARRPRSGSRTGCSCPRASGRKRG